MPIERFYFYARTNSSRLLTNADRVVYWCYAPKLKEKQMTDFVRIGPHIVSKKNISHIKKEIDSVERSMMIIVYFNDSTVLSVRFDNLANLANNFQHLVQSLT